MFRYNKFVHILTTLLIGTAVLGAGKKPIKVYFAGPLFTMPEMEGNFLIGEAIERVSKGRYLVIKPQSLSSESGEALALRDRDYRKLMINDVGIFMFDLPDPDSGTVAEYLYLKQLGKPAVWIRTDSRRFREEELGPDGPINLMLKGFPRTRVVKDVIPLFHSAAIVDQALQFKANGGDPWPYIQNRIKAVFKDCIPANAKKADWEKLEKALDSQLAFEIRQIKASRTLRSEMNFNLDRLELELEKAVLAGLRLVLACRIVGALDEAVQDKPIHSFKELRQVYLAAWRATGSTFQEKMSKAEVLEAASQAVRFERRISVKAERAGE